MNLCAFDSTTTKNLAILSDYYDELQEARMDIPAWITDYGEVEDKSSLYSMFGVDTMEELMDLLDAIEANARRVASWHDVGKRHFVQLPQIWPTGSINNTYVLIRQDFAQWVRSAPKMDN